MSKWSDTKWIVEQLQRKWDNGAIPRELLTQTGLFPLTFSLKKPKSNEITSNFADVYPWIDALREASKRKRGYGFELIEKEIVHRQLGRNPIPTHALITTIDDALKLIKKNREAEKIQKDVSLILSEWIVLNDWAQKFPLKVLQYYNDWTNILAVLRWFYEHPNSGLYMRQMDIPGVDTKFVENKKRILTELLNIILPEEYINQKAGSFEGRFGLCEKPIRIRMRFLDTELYINGLEDISAPFEQVALFNPNVSTVFITENEINGLSFPNVKGSIVIFGLGYAVDILKTINWLKEKAVYYWGDLDTHGFKMLDQVRQFFPQVKSILMNEDILLDSRDLWVIEKEPFYGSLSRLTKDEQQLFFSLQNNMWGENVRLEQERIPFTRVQDEVQKAIRDKVLQLH
jgi:hypothetical protein